MTISSATTAPCKSSRFRSNELRSFDIDHMRAYDLEEITSTKEFVMLFAWNLESSVEVRARAETVWSVWTDVGSWSLWDKGLEWGELEGPFCEGARGRLKPRGWPATDFLVTECVDRRVFADETRFPFTTANFRHQMSESGEGRLLLTHRVTVRGLLAPMLRLTVGRLLKRDLPKAMLELRDFIEAQDERKEGSTVSQLRV